MRKLKKYTVTVTIGNGNEEGVCRVTVELEAFTEQGAKKKALELALAQAGVVYQVSDGQVKGTNAVYTECFGKTPEPW